MTQLNGKFPSPLRPDEKTTKLTCQVKSRGNCVTVCVCVYEYWILSSKT
jgi:hypothetical protein